MDSPVALSPSPTAKAGVGAGTYEPGSAPIPAKGASVDRQHGNLDLAFLPSPRPHHRSPHHYHY